MFLTANLQIYILYLISSRLPSYLFLSKTSRTQFMYCFVKQTVVRQWLRCCGIGSKFKVGGGDKPPPPQFRRLWDIHHINAGSWNICLTTQDRLVNITCTLCIKREKNTCMVWIWIDIKISHTIQNSNMCSS